MFAELLRHARMLLPGNPTQDDIAERLAALGHPVSQTTVSAWENGPHVPRSKERLAAIAAVYGLDLAAVKRAAEGPQRESRPAATPTNADLAADIARLQGVLEEVLRALGVGATPAAPRPPAG